MVVVWGALLLFVAATAYSCIRRFTTLDLFKIPSPWGIPLVGQLIQLGACPYTPHEQFLKWHEALGPIVRLRVLHRDIVLVSDPHVASQLLAKGPNECFRRAPEYTTYDVAHGMPGCHAIMTERDEERWRTIRKGIAPAYSMAAIRDCFPTLVQCYAHICQRIADGSAWHMQPPQIAATTAGAAAAADITATPAEAATAADPVDSPGSSSSSPSSSPSDARSSSSNSPQAAATAAAATAAAAAGKAVCIDEEIFAGTMRAFTLGFLRMSPESLQAFDFQQTASDVTGLVAITNTFLSQPWKQWLYLGFPRMCEESRAFHAQRNRLMKLTDTLAHHVETHRKTLQLHSSSTGGSTVITGPRKAGKAATAGPETAACSAAAAADVANAVAAVAIQGTNAAAAAAAAAGAEVTVGRVTAAAAAGGGGPQIDTSLVGCLAKLLEPATGRPFSHQALQAELFLETVGQESIPWTMAWTLFLLTQNPQVEAKVLSELRSVGVPCNGDIAAAAACVSLDTLKQLPYCTAVLQEAMRMFPAGVMAASRMTEQVTQVGPYQVPPGVIVFPCLYNILMDPNNWEEPHKFKPERWLDPKAATDPVTGANRFVPFGIGPKACVAQQLAYVQLKVLMVLLLSSFTWRLAPCMGGPQGVLSNTVAALELRVAQGMWLLPTPRSAGSC